MFIKLETTPADKPSDWKDESESAYYIYKSQNSSLHLYKRHDPPSTYAFIDEAGKLRFGYQTPNEHEHLHGSLETNGELRVERDLHSILPLFYQKTDDTLMICNDYAQLRTRPFELNYDQLISSLYLLGDRWDTLDANINIIPPNVTMHYSKTGMEITRNQARSDIATESDPAQMPERLGERLDYQLAEYGVSEVALLSSGGLDSSSIAILAARSGYPVHLFSAEFEATYRASQRAKLDAVASIVNGQLNLTAFVESRHAPMSRFIGTTPEPMYEGEEFYWEIMSDVMKEVRSYGHSVLFDGCGGDELFIDESPQYELCAGPGWKQAARQSSTYTLSPYTDELLRTYIDTRPDTADAPLEVLPSSIYAGAVATNNLFIEHGVWPVSPLADKPLYDYFRKLQPHYRANKNILRAWYEALEAPAVLYADPKQNEHFDTIMDTTIDSIFKTRTRELGGLPALAELGIISSNKPERFLDAPSTLKYQLLVSEQNLQAG